MVLAYSIRGIWVFSCRLAHRLDTRFTRLMLSRDCVLFRLPVTALLQHPFADMARQGFDGLLNEDDRGSQHWAT
jgi:hypothetical protein